ncbi:hypothetical protein N9Y41_04000 [Planktomarina temperata]|nr:hypothetical protein [Planktomarina temperata]
MREVLVARVVQALLALVVGLNLAACGTSNLISEMNDGFAPNETVYKAGPILRKGVTKAGNKYTIMRNGDVNLDGKGWEVYPRFKSYCKTDPIDDSELCIYDSLHRSFFASRTRDGTLVGLCIGNDFPGRNGAIRVGKNPAVYTDGANCLSGKRARRIGQQLLDNEEYTVKVYRWPNDFPIKATFKIGNEFRDIHDLTSFVNKNLSQLRQPYPVQ